MSKDEKFSVDLKKPSTKKQHTAAEWAKHIALVENEDVKRDIMNARQRLGQFSARYVIEAICAGEPDGDRLAAQMLSFVDNPDQLIDEMTVDPRALKKLAQNVGGQRADHVVQHSVLREIPEEYPQSGTHTIKTEVVREKAPQKEVSDRQVELLRELLKTMDPDVVKRALLGD